MSEEYVIETSYKLEDGRLATISSTLSDEIIDGIPFIFYRGTYVPFKFRGHQLPRKIVPKLCKELRELKQMPSIDYTGMESDRHMSAYTWIRKYHPEFNPSPSLSRVIKSARLIPNIKVERALMPENTFGVWVWFPDGQTSATYKKIDEDIMDMVSKFTLSYIKGRQ
jgi:hypothetical protein